LPLSSQSSTSIHSMYAQFSVSCEAIQVFCMVP
jgi:hypothetical protein